MSVREGDLSKFTDLIELLDSWKAAAANIGVDLMEVRVSPGNQTANTVWYNDNGIDSAFWEIN